jgi:hypothetical protein
LKYVYVSMVWNTHVQLGDKNVRSIPINAGSLLSV